MAEEGASVSPWSVTTDDGWTLRGDLYEPAGDAIGVVLLGHAMMVDRRTMDRPRGEGIGAHLAGAGFVVFNVDFRGHGESLRPDSPAYSFDDIVQRDIPALFAALAERFGDLPRSLVGHSLGVHAGLPGVALLPHGTIDASVAFAPNLWMPKLEQSRWRRMKKGTQLAFFDLASRRSGFFDPSRFGMGKSRIARAYVEQFREAWRTDGLRDASGEVDYEAAIAELAIPILAVTSEGDALMAHPDAAEAWMGLFESADVTIRRVARDEAFVPDHMGYVIQPAARPLWEEAALFLRQHASRAMPATA